MTFAPHTLELTLTPDTKKFNKLLSGAYKKAKEEHKLYEVKNVHYDHAISTTGVKIEYHDGTYKKKIKFIVNPSRLLGGDDLKLWKPSKDNIEKFLRELNEHIENYFDDTYGLDDFQLTRIDFTVNINVKSRKAVSAYIKVLHKLGKVKGFSSKFTKQGCEDYNINQDHSFDLAGNSNGIEFTAYDKEAELSKKKEKSGRKGAESEKKKAKGILRIEVRLVKPKAVRKYTDETVTSRQLSKLIKRSKEIFLDTFTQVVPYGNFYKKDEAVRIITENVVKKKQREKMLLLLELIPKKKSLLLAQKELNDRRMDKIMAAFAELELSPVTISKRMDVKRLKGLYFYL